MIPQTSRVTDLDTRRGLACKIKLGDAISEAEALKHGRFFEIPRPSK